jgi:methylisocitrate lyase
MGAAERGLDTLDAEGSLQSEVAAMQTRVRLYELLDYEAYNTFDQSIFNFSVPGEHDDR